MMRHTTRADESQIPITQSRSEVLNNAKKAKDDEYYTFISDIEAEALNHTELFNDAVVWCPFDTVQGSNFWKFFHENFERLGLRELISTGLGQPFIATYTGGNDLDVSVFDTVPIDGDGSYDSDDFLPLRERFTVIVTNPPFSLYSDIIANNKWFFSKDYLVITPLTIWCRDFIMKEYVKGELFPGVNKISKFGRPDSTVKSVACSWLTTHRTPIKQKITQFQELDEQYDGGVPVVFVEKLEHLNDPRLARYRYLAVPITYGMMYSFDNDEFEVVKNMHKVTVGGVQKFQRWLIRRR